MKITKILFLSSIALSGILYGCAGQNKVANLISEEKYSEAYDEIEKNPEKYSEFKDEVTYELAKEAADSKDYAKALEYLEDNSASSAQELKSEVEQKKVDSDFLNAMAKGLDARYVAFRDYKKEFSKDSYVIPIKNELDLVQEFKDKDFYDKDLESLAKDYIEGCEKQYKAFDQWDENLFKTSLNNLSANGYRLEAVQKINAKYPLQVEDEDSKQNLKDYNNLAKEGIQQKIYDSFELTEEFRSDNMVQYKLTGKNHTEDVFDPKDSGYDSWLFISNRLVDRNGDYVADITSESIGLLRPGQSFKLDVWVDENIGDLKDYFME